MESIKNNLDFIRKKIERAAIKSGRSVDDIQIVAVSKTHPAAKIQEAYEQGQRLFGENRIQEALPKIAKLANLDIEWHLVGHLQSNKAKLAVQNFHLIHSVDSLKIAKTINKYASMLKKYQNILLQVNVSGETSKFGVSPEHIEELVIKLMDMKNIRIRGLMTIPPLTLNPETSRPYFSALNKMFRLLKSKYPKNLGSMDILSMGMSNDFEVAIEEGATMVRIGTAIFGAREAHK